MSQLKKPKGTLDLVGAQPFAQWTKILGIEAGCGRWLRGALPRSDTGFDITALAGTNAEDATLLIGIAVAKDFFEIVSKLRIGDSHTTICKSKARVAASKQTLEVLDGKNGFFSCRKVDMEIEPSLTFFADGKVGFDANKVTGDMLKAVAFGNIPLCFQYGKGRCIKTNDGILSAQDGFSFRILETKSRKFHEGASFGCGILNAGCRVSKGDLRLEMSQGSFDVDIHHGNFHGWLGAFRQWRVSER